MWRKVIIICIVLVLAIAFAVVMTMFPKKAETIQLQDPDAITSIDITMIDGTQIGTNQMDEIEQIVKALAGAEPTRIESVNDTPDASYGTIRIYTETDYHDIYYYERDGEFFVEQPYHGIYRLEHDFDRDIPEAMLTGKSNNYKIPKDSILLFDDIKGSKKLLEDISEGNTPDECNILYDQMGANPDVTITDPDEIVRVYQMLGEISVKGKSNTNITDNYHHVYFKLRDGTSVGYNFEGEGLLCVGSNNYEVAGGKNLWQYMKEKCGGE